MTEVNTDIYKNLVPINPYEKINQLSEMTNRLTTAEKGRKELEAMKAAGPLMQQAIDPQTGQVDIGKYISLVARNPKTSILAPTLVQQGLQTQGVNLDNIGKTLTQDLRRYEAIGSSAIGLVDQHGEGVTHSHVRSQVDLLVKQGALDHKQAAAFLASAATIPEGPKLRQFLLTQGSGAQSAAQALSSIQSQFGMVDRGGQVDVKQTAPGAAPKTLGSYAKTPTTDQLNQSVREKSPTGEETEVPRAQRDQLVDGMGRPIQKPGAAAPVPAAPIEKPQATVPPSTAPGAGREAMPPVLPSPTPSPRVVNLPPGQGERLVAGGKYYEKLQKDAQSAVGQLKTAGDIRDLIAAAPGGKLTGGGTEIRENLARIGQAIGLSEKVVDNIAGNSLGDVQAAQKQLYNLLGLAWNQNFGSTRDSPSNLEWELLRKSNPNLEVDPRGIEKMLGFIEKIAEAKLQEQKAYDAWVRRKGPDGKVVDPNGERFGAFWNEYALGRIFGRKKQADGSWK